MKIKDQFALVGCIIGASLFVSACQLSAVESIPSLITIESSDDNIVIMSAENEHNRIYRVHGKTFGWNDLTPAQQNKLRQFEQKIAVAEAKLQVNDKEFSLIGKQMEERAKVIEAEARKLKEVTIRLEKNEVSFADLGEISRRLEEKAQVNQALMRMNELELHKLEKQLPKIDQAVIDEINTQAKKLEIALVEIAATLP